MQSIGVDSEGAKHLFSLCEKKHFRPIRDGTATDYLHFSLRKQQNLPKVPTMHAQPSTNGKHCDHGAPPHCPKSCQHMTGNCAALAKNISADSWGQCALIRCNSQKKGQMLTQKTYLLFTSAPVSGLQNDIQ